MVNIPKRFAFNWSYSGNRNPYTGSYGTKNSDFGYGTKPFTPNYGFSPF